MAKFNNIIKWIFLIGFSTTLVMQVAGDDDEKSIVEKVNATLGLIEADFENLGKKIHSGTTINPTNTTIVPSTKPTVPSTKPTVPSTKPTVPSTKPTVPTSKPLKETRKKRDVLSQIWEMKMRKMQNKLATVAPPMGVATLTNAMANVTTVTDEIADGTIKQDQVTRVEVAETAIKAVVKNADGNLISYMKKNPNILTDLQKDAAAASKTVKKYYDDHFEDDGGANVGAIVGGVCGGVAGVGLLGFGYYYYKKKQS